MKKQFNTEGWRWVLLYFALLFCFALTVGCTTIEPQKPYTLQTAEGVELPDSVNGWGIVRTGINEYTFVPPKPGPHKAKYKNVGNTTIKDSGNTKAKGEAIIGNDNAPVEAKKHAVIGDGNTISKPASNWKVFVGVGIGIAVLLYIGLRYVGIL